MLCDLTYCISLYRDSALFWSGIRLLILILNLKIMLEMYDPRARYTVQCRKEKPLYLSRIHYPGPIYLVPFVGEKFKAFTPPLPYL